MAFLLLIVMACNVAFAGGGRVLLDGTAALVGKTLVTWQDARFFLSLERFRSGQGKPLETDEASVRKAIQKIVFEDMVFQEMVNLRPDEKPSAGEEASLRAERQRGREAEWQALLRYFGRSEAQAVQTVGRSLKVEQFIQQKIETLTPIVTEGEMQRYYEPNRALLGNRPFEAVKPTIALLLKKQKMQKGLEDWVKFLKEKYGVTNLLDYADGG